MNIFEIGDLVYWYPDMSLTPYVVMKIWSGINRVTYKKEKYVDLLSLTQDPNTKTGKRWAKQIVLSITKPSIVKVLEYKGKSKQKNEKIY